MIDYESFAALLGWLREQLDGDERVARAANLERHRKIVVEALAWGELGAHRNARFIAEWTPARVLAEIAVKREIIEIPARGSQDPELEIVQLLALPYADRPGWREEWNRGAESS